VREFFGTRVVVPFPALEDTDSPEVRAWVERQNQLSTRLLAGPRCSRHLEFLDRHWCEAPKILPIERPGRVFYLEHGRDQEQPVLWCREDAADLPRCVLDPAELGVAGAALAAEQVSISPSGRFAALALCREGSEGMEIRVWDATRGALLVDAVPPTAVATVAWHPSERGFFYNVTRSLIGEQALGQVDGLYWHQLGTEARDDACLRSYADGAGHSLHPHVTADGRFLLGVPMNFVTTERGLWRWFCPRDPGEALPEPTVVLEDGEAPWSLVGERGSLLYLTTQLDAPNGRVVAIDLERPGREHWRELVAESDHALGRDTYGVAARQSLLAGDRLLLTYVHHGHHRVHVHTLDGRPAGQLELPSPCTVYQVAPASGGSAARLSVATILEPNRVHLWTAAGLELESRMPSALDEEDFVVEQVFYDSSDGTRIPMVIAHRRDLELDGDRPTFLYGYGGYGQAVTPKYYAEVALWLQLGGVYAYANLRGGGEYGTRWRRAGSGTRKQNSFDDLHAAAGWLVEKGYTRAARLGIKGLSMGGLLTATCYNQRPDLYGAVISEVPLVDVLALGDTEKGRAIASELGNPLAEREAFEAIRAYSPLHNVSPSDGAADGGDAAPAKPPLLVVVAEQDESALPGQAYRFAAACQAAARGDELVLLRVVHGVGHTGWPRSLLVRTLAEEITFFEWALAPSSPEGKSTGQLPEHAQ
jgi:prolyl oligopeptidase